MPLQAFLLPITTLAVSSTSWMVPGAGHCAEGSMCINACPQHPLCARLCTQHRGCIEGGVGAACAQGAPRLTQGLLGTGKETGTKQGTCPKRQRVFIETHKLDFQRSQGVEGLFSQYCSGNNRGDRWSRETLEAGKQWEGYCNSPGVNLN